MKRKSGKKLLVIILIIILIPILVAAGLFIFRNQIAKSIIEKSGSAIAGAKVDVDGVYIKPFTVHIKWDRLQFTNRKNTMQNLFETGKCEFELAFKPLLASKVIIEKMQLDGMLFETKREIDGKLPPKKKRKKSQLEKDIEAKLMAAIQENLEKEKAKIPVFDPAFLDQKVDVDSLMAILNFKTPAKADSLKKVVESRYDHWDDRLKNNSYEKDYNSIKSDVLKIKPKEIKTVVALEKNLRLANDAYKRSEKLFKDVKRDKTEIEKDLKTIKKLKKDIPAWIKHDYERALALAKLPDISVSNIAAMLFGDEIADGLMKVLENVKTSRELSKPQKKPKKDKMPNLPGLWIKEISLSATTNDGVNLSGYVHDISNDQKKTRKPMHIELSGVQENVGRIDIDARFDYRTDKTHENIDLKIDDVPIKNLKMTNFELLPTKLKRGDGKLVSEVDIVNGIVNSDIYFEIDNVKFDYSSQPEMNERLVRISRSITHAIQKITFDANVKQTEDGFKFKVDSNLDNLIVKQLKKVLSEEVERAKAELKTRINKELNKYKKELESIIAEREKEVQNEIDKIYSKVDSQKKEIEKKRKELEKKINREKKKIEDKAKKEADKKQKELEAKAKKEADKLKNKLKWK
ncbi:MAG: TIGR03545 family protein [Candidatus Cloacimonetes bacterium]|nr:TIGR03545 family protein [Candidatus Cloacimonadota bacterium]